MKRLFVYGALLLSAVTPAFAADKIVAVVNDQVITSDQLEGRTKLTLRQLGLENAPVAQRTAVARRTLSVLVDEELQRQYATTARVKLKPEDMTRVKAAAVKSLGGEASFANLTRGLEQPANDKLAAEALWQRIIARDVQPRVQVSTVEADRLISELAKSRHVLDREISVIQLNAGSGADSDREQLARLNELKQKITGGDNFADLARAYSEDKSAANGGNLGWFSGGELNPQLEEALDKMQPGQISEPIRTPMGWYLVKLENVRTTKPVETGPQTQLELFLLAAPAPADAKQAKELSGKLNDKAKELRKGFEVRAYFAKGAFSEEFPASKALGWVTESDLEKELAGALNGVGTGSWSKDVTVNGTMAKVFVADNRQVMSDQLSAYRERVMNNMFGNRVELESRRFMQNLRQKAFLDVRL